MMETSKSLIDKRRDHFSRGQRRASIPHDINLSLKFFQFLGGEVLIAQYLDGDYLTAHLSLPNFPVVAALQRFLKYNIIIFNDRVPF